MLSDGKLKFMNLQKAAKPLSGYKERQHCVANGAFVGVLGVYLCVKLKVILLE